MPDTSHVAQQLPAKGWSQPRLDMQIQPARKPAPKQPEALPLNQQHASERERGIQHVLPFDAPEGEHPMARIARMTYDPNNRDFFEARALESGPGTTSRTRQRAYSDLMSHYQRAHGMDDAERFRVGRVHDKQLKRQRKKGT